MGDPKEVGVDDVMKPDYGEAVDIYEGEIPVFWPCGVTPQAAIENAKPPIAVSYTHLSTMAHYWKKKVLRNWNKKAANISDLLLSLIHI